MKKKGNKCDCHAARAEELRAVFFSQKNYSTCDEVMRKTIKTPASRFWVEPERARDVLTRFERNPESISKMHAERQRMYLALYEKYQSMRLLHPDETKLGCVAMAIYSGAPEFFLSPSTARSIIYS